MGVKWDNLPLLIILSGIALVFVSTILDGPDNAHMEPNFILMKQSQRLDADIDEVGNGQEQGPVPRRGARKARYKLKPPPSSEEPQRFRERDTSKNIATGIDFLRIIPWKIEIDTNYFFGRSFLHETNDSYLRLAQTFIRNVKGLPVEKTHQMSLYYERAGKNVEWTMQPYHLTRLCKTEFEIFKILKLYSFKEDYQESRLPLLESYFRDFQATSFRALLMVNASNVQKDESDRESPYFYIATHPLLVYQMIRRIVQDIPKIKYLLRKNIDLMGKLRQAEKELSFNFPTALDLMEALNSIHRIQTVNDIKTLDLAKGKWEGMKTRIEIDVFQALEIGAFYIAKDTNDLAMEWFHYGMELAETSPASDMYPEIVNFFEMSLGFCAKLHNRVRGLQLDVKEKLTPTWGPVVYTKNVTYPYYPSNYTREFDLKKSEIAEFRLQWRKNNTLQGRFANTIFPILHARLCAGDNFQTQEEKRKLKCWLETRTHPYWYINPLKVELMNANPPMVQVYEFISHDLGEFLRAVAVDRLNRSLVYTGEGNVDDIRTSYQAWLDERFLSCESNKSENCLSIITHFSHQLEHLTGLSILANGSSEAYQVAVYGSSHHFGPHLDPREIDVKNKTDLGLGTRITTVMGYLTDVKAGGRTAFPLLGFSVKPVKGSIFMWNNLQNDGIKREFTSFHGGCPVTQGIKWITNKWIHNDGNMFTLKCGLNAPDVFMPNNLEQQMKMVDRNLP